MNLYNPLLEEIIYAFQYPKILSLLSEITGIPQLLPDEYLYAGGISLMDRGCFLNPHIDNSGSSLLFMLNQQTRCQDNILLTQKFRKFLKP
ncbi:hypothetical protein MAESPC_00584 [Microcystis aeruginosa SPC777]|uniref:Uncharacterized protein n=1 Tax=Microcystis aeruginosa SPC777 TaxID=482300 RepID=S3JF85_MICAE|nr:hypothetical protein MAESPC_00584 [Microcystis aeruginosa SPC777]